MLLVALPVVLIAVWISTYKLFQVQHSAYGLDGPLDE